MLVCQIVRVIGDVDAVLLSQPDLQHVGAIPYAVGKLGTFARQTVAGLTAPIYATLPVWRMGEMFMYDAHESRSKYGFDTFSLDDVDSAFMKVNQLKYSQEVKFGGLRRCIILQTERATEL